MDIPNNSCAYSTTLDYVREVEWLTSVCAKFQDLPHIGNCLRKRPYAGRSTNYKDAMQEICHWDIGNIKLEQIEDPWIIMWKLKIRLFELSQEVIDPILQLQCGYKILGDWDMIREDQHRKFEMSTVNCGRCRKTRQTPKIRILP